MSKYKLYIGSWMLILTSLKRLNCQEFTIQRLYMTSIKIDINEISLEIRNCNFVK